MTKSCFIVPTWLLVVLRCSRLQSILITHLYYDTSTTTTMYRRIYLRHVGPQHIFRVQRKQQRQSFRSFMAQTFGLCVRGAQVHARCSVAAKYEQGQ